MSDSVCIRLLPLEKSLTVERGTPLHDVLFAQGVEFPCGGQGRCKGCRVKVLAGEVAASPQDQALLTQAELASGWRLACCARAAGDLTLELAQWEAVVLGDDSAFAFTPQAGLGVALDLGTTTLAAQLLDLATGHVLAVRTALNAQGRHGADIMSRIDFALRGDGLRVLEQMIRRQLGRLVTELLTTVPGRAGELREIVVVGNTVMHHLFCGLSVEPLSRHPFEPVDAGLQLFPAVELGWRDAGQATIRFLPCAGGFVGSDILAGVLATRLHESEALAALVDLGTNGEMVVGNRQRLLCASTAAGPAFEGARISMGMRAATGAVSEVSVVDGGLQCRVLGGGAPRGLCGSGLVDAVAAGLELGLIAPRGRLPEGRDLPLLAPVVLTQTDVRELQLAKGAIAAGLRVLVQQWGARLEDITRLHLAGAFGNYINRRSAHRIGLLEVSPERVSPAGNTALAGAKLALFHLHEDGGSFVELRSRMSHVMLNEDPSFEEAYVDAMSFPSGTGMDSMIISS